MKDMDGDGENDYIKKLWNTWTRKNAANGTKQLLVKEMLTSRANEQIISKEKELGSRERIIKNSFKLLAQTRILW
jgi:hypothetical protein